MPPKIRPQEYEVLPDGSRADRLSKGPYVQNMERYGRHWRTRRGFGQVGQFDSTLGVLGLTIERHLGSHIMTTNFGHEQIVSVFRVLANTGNVVSTGVAPAPADDPTGEVGQTLYAYQVVIYDLTTDDIWEEILHPKTAEDSRAAWLHHGLYESDRDVSYEAWMYASDDPFFFEEFDDVLFFGNRSAGVVTYIPATFDGTRNQQLAGAYRRDWNHEGRSETSLLVRLVATPGLFADAHVYLTTGEFPTPTDVTVYDGRLVFVDGRNLWFSDRGRPASIAALNRVSIPSENDAVAVVELNGNIVVFTRSERFVYQPAFFDGLISAGEVIVGSREIGVVGPTALKRVGAAVTFVDRTGLYTTSDGFTEADLSDRSEIKSFWREAIENPLTNYYQDVANPGFTDLADDQPRMQHRFDPKGCHIEYDHVRDHLLVCFPEENFLMAWGQDAPYPSFWIFESMAASTATGVKATANIDKPWMLMGETDLFMVGSNDRATIADDIAGSTESKSLDSHYVLQYGRGGGVDRTLDYGVSDVFAEDDRLVSGKYYTRTPTPALGAGDSIFYLEPWRRVPDGWQAPNGVAGLDDVYLLPVELAIDPEAFVGGAASPPDVLTLIFTFDNTKWTPVLRGATAEFDFLLPPERMKSSAGWGMGAPTAGLREVQVYLAGVADPTGDEVRIRFEGNIAGYTGHAAPYLALNLRSRNRLLWLPFRYTGAASDDVFSLGVGQASAASYQRLGAGAYGPVNSRFLAWGQAHAPGAWKTADVDAQPVDWAIKTMEVVFVDWQGNPVPGAQIMARTLKCMVRSHGKGETLVVSDSVYGLLNAAVGSDWKGWSSQIVDHVGDNPSRILDRTTIRSRVKDSAGAMQTRTFNGTPTWGNPANGAHGNYLVDSEQVDRITFSDSVRGEHLFWMLHGHVRNRAEEIAIESMTAKVVRRSGRHRRWGRP